MSEPFVNGPFPMRWEFDTLLNDLTAAAFEVPTNGVAYAEARADVLRAYDATLARIAELDPLNKRIVLKLHEIVNRNPHPEGSLGQNLEDVIDRQITALMRENELLGQRCKQLSDIRDEWRENAETTFDETVALRERIAELEERAVESEKQWSLTAEEWCARAEERGRDAGYREGLDAASDRYGYP